MKDKKIAKISAMAFHHSDGLVPSWQLASRFVGKNGRVATLPDIISARLATKLEATPWEQYFTTSSAEYFGRTRGGSRIIIVAHNVGPMSTLEGILKAYSYEYKDKSRSKRGGRISYQEFNDLESGKYGPVDIVDVESYVHRYQYPFIEFLRSSQALHNPLLKARMGPRAEEYINYHTTLARQWHQAQAGIDEENRYGLPDWPDRESRRKAKQLRYAEITSDPYLLQLSDANNCSYGYSEKKGDFISFLEKREGPYAHLLSMSQVMHHHLSAPSWCEALAFDVSCHEWNDGCRFVGVHTNSPINDIHPGLYDIYNLIGKHWQSLMKPMSNCPRIKFRALMMINNRIWFTEAPKVGDGMDSGVPEFLVTSLTPIGEPTEFVTKTRGYHGFFKYGIKEVQRIAPSGANSYSLVGDPENIWTDGNPNHQHVSVQFYKANIDTSQRLLRTEEICNDYEIFMNLALKDNS